MRLGVHMSILDMGAHAAPDALKDKWIQTSRANAHRRTMSGGLDAFDISVMNKSRTLKWIPVYTNHRRAKSSPVSPQEIGDDLEGPAASPSIKENRGIHSWISHTTAEKLHHVIDRLEDSPNRDSGDGGDGGSGGGGVAAKLIPTFHKRRKSEKQKVLDTSAG